MANRPKTKRNQKIVELANKGWRYKSIANMFKMETGAVQMVIWRARHRKDGGNENEPRRLISVPDGLQSNHKITKGGGHNEDTGGRR